MKNTMKKATNATQTTEKNTTNTLNINKLTIQELRNFLDYAYNSLSSKKETNAKKRMAIDLLKNLKSKKTIIKKSEYTDTVKILLSEFPSLKKFFSNEEEDKKEVKKEDNKKEVKKETKKEVKKEANKKEVKAEEVKKEVVKTNKKDERAFPSGIKLDKRTFKKVSVTFEELKKKFEEGKEDIIAYYWTQQDIEVFGYCSNAEYIKKPTQFRYNLDLAKVVYATDSLIYAISLQTYAVYMLTADDFNRHSDGYLYSGGVEFEVYSSK